MKWNSYEQSNLATRQAFQGWEKRQKLKLQKDPSSLVTLVCEAVEQRHKNVTNCTGEGMQAVFTMQFHLTMVWPGQRASIIKIHSKEDPTENVNNNRALHDKGWHTINYCIIIIAA